MVHHYPKANTTWLTAAILSTGYDGCSDSDEILNSVLKSLVRRLNSSGDIAMYRFWRFGLKLPIHAPFWEVFGEYFLHMTSPIVQTPKMTVLGRKHVI